MNDSHVNSSYGCIIHLINFHLILFGIVKCIPKSTPCFNLLVEALHQILTIPSKSIVSHCNSHSQTRCKINSRNSKLPASLKMQFICHFRSKQGILPIFSFVNKQLTFYKTNSYWSFQVSWIRSKDSYMLYIGDVKFVDDDRFELLPGNGYSDWTLRFRLIREADAGNYECQISTSPKLSQTFTLNVVGKSKVFITIVPHFHQGGAC